MINERQFELDYVVDSLTRTREGLSNLWEEVVYAKCTLHRLRWRYNKGENFCRMVPRWYYPAEVHTELDALQCLENKQAALKEEEDQLMRKLLGIGTAISDLQTRLAILDEAFFLINSSAGLQ